MEPLLSLSLSLSLFLHPAEASVLGGVHTTNAAGRILNHKFMRVSGRNRRQSYRGYGPTMAFWLPLNASVLFLPFFFSRNSTLHPRISSIQFNRPLCNALSIAFFIGAHCPPFLHPCHRALRVFFVNYEL